MKHFYIKKEMCNICFHFILTNFHYKRNENFFDEEKQFDIAQDC
jgi:hypothetical protein